MNNFSLSMSIVFSNESNKSKDLIKCNMLLFNFDNLIIFFSSKDKPSSLGFLFCKEI